MITREELLSAQTAAAQLITLAGFVLAEGERSKIEVADFGLGAVAVEGAQILTLVQTGRIGVKLIALTPWQTLPEHWHPQVGSDPGKEETVRVLSGVLHFYVAGPDTLSVGRIPRGKEACYTLRHELLLRPGDQVACEPGEKHWFQGGPKGAVAFSFSSVARDVLDQFTDSAVRRVTEVRD